MTKTKTPWTKTKTLWTKTKTPLTKTKTLWTKTKTPLTKTKTLPLPPLSFFGSCFISRAAKTKNPVPRSFFATKPNGNACYAGYTEEKCCRGGNKGV